MKKSIKTITILCAALCALIVFISVSFDSEAGDTIYSGIYIETINVSGMTKQQAQDAVYSYLADMENTMMSFVVSQGEIVEKRLGDLCPKWVNTEIIDEAFDVGNEGNVIQRYKSIRDIEANGKVFELQISFDEAAVREFIENECAQYDVPVENSTLNRVNGEFVIVDGNFGEAVDVDGGILKIQDELYSLYKSGYDRITLNTLEVVPEGNSSDLALVKDLLGTFTTDYSSSGSNRSYNVENATRKIDGIVLYPGEEFSTFDTIAPFSTANGYYMAGSYMNGQVVDSMGGGICQVSSTLYNAVLLSELEVTERHNHSMVVTYVNKSADAAITESGKDFRFVNNTDYPIYIEGYNEGKTVTFNIYGVETRPDNRKVEYESLTLSESVPSTEQIIADPSAIITSVAVTPMHVGYKAELWKVVYEDGQEVEREQINSSSYSATPRTAVVGLATSNPEYLSRMQEAIATGSVDMCLAVAAQIASEGVY